MSQFNKGDKVLYIPPHAEQDLNHPDTEVGVVKEIFSSEDEGPKYLVDYDDGSPNAKLTYERDLYSNEG